MFGKKNKLPQQPSIVIQPPMNGFEEMTEQQVQDYNQPQQQAYNPQPQQLPPMPQPSQQFQRRPQMPVRKALIVKTEIGDQEGTFVSTIVTNFDLSLGDCEVNQ